MHVEQRRELGVGVDRAQAEIYQVTDKRSSEDYAPLSEIMDGVLDEIEAISNREAGLYGVPTGFADLDDLTNGLHAGQMIIVAARPAMGKSTLALDLCPAASIHNNLASCFFSLEMTRSEITMRLLSAEAKVPLNHIRNGAMTDDDWAKLARKMGEVSSAPIFIDDSPNMTMMEIRAKARRLKQRHDLKLIVIDYLQLMSSGKKVESRQLEVSEFSRQIKLLAKELELPIIALSQLNRGPEQRGDKRPMMSDLRESGCVTADTRLLRADTNAEVTIGELLESGATDVPVWALDDRLKLVPRTLTHAFPSGTKEVFELTLASGRRVTATGNHPFLTYDGWVPLRELTVGARVGSIRHVPPPLQITPRDDDEVLLLAHLLGDGSFVRRQPIRYASTAEANLQAVAAAASRRFGITAKRDDYPAARVTTMRLPAPFRLARGRRQRVLPVDQQDGLAGVGEVEVAAGTRLDVGGVGAGRVRVELRLQRPVVALDLRDGAVQAGFLCLKLARSPGLLAEGDHEVDADEEDEQDRDAVALLVEQLGDDTGHRAPPAAGAIASGIVGHRVACS